MHLTASAARPRGGIAGQRQSLAAKHGLTPTGGRPGAVASPQRRARASSWPARRRASAPNPRRRSARARPSRRCGSPGSARASLRRIPAIVSGPAELAKADLLAEIPDERILAWLKANGPSPAVTAALLEAWKPKQLVKVPVADWDTLLQQAEGSATLPSSFYFLRRPILVASSGPSAPSRRIGSSTAACALKRSARRH